MLRKIRKIWKFVRYSSFWIFIQIGLLFSANPGDIVITEFFFQSGGNIYEYIEIFNTTSDNINLMDWKIEVNGNKYSITIIIENVPIFTLGITAEWFGNLSQVELTNEDGNIDCIYINTDTLWFDCLEMGEYNFGFSYDSECGSNLGNVNGDENIDILDLVQISFYILGISIPNFECSADSNGDDSVNILDLVQIANYILDN